MTRSRSIPIYNGESVPWYIKAIVWRESTGECTYCGKRVDPAVPPTERNSVHFDHVIPRSKGGTNDPDNIVVSCSPCNIAKKDRNVAEFMGMSVKIEPDVVVNEGESPLRKFPERLLFTIRESAIELGVTERKLWSMARAGEIAVFDGLGPRLTRIRRVDLEEASRKREAA